MTRKAALLALVLSAAVAASCDPLDQLLDAAESTVGNRDRSQIRRVRRLGRRVDRLGRRFDSRAASLGLTACAKP